MSAKEPTTALTVERKKEIKEYIDKCFGSTLAVPEATKAYALIALGFDAAFHMCLYHSKLTMTIDGWYWWAHRDKEFDRLTTRAIVEQEERDAYGLTPDQIGVLASIYLKGRSEPIYTGFSHASKNEKAPVIHGSAVESKHPYRMAEKRAEAQVIRKAYPLGVDVQLPEEMSTSLSQEDDIEGEAKILDGPEETAPEEAKPLKVVSKPRAKGQGAPPAETEPGTDEPFPPLEGEEGGPEIQRISQDYHNEIESLRKDLKIGDKELANALFQRFGKSKISELTQIEAGQVISGMQAKLEKKG